MGAPKKAAILTATDGPTWYYERTVAGSCIPPDTEGAAKAFLACF
jgi:hypothetical protein